MKTLINYYVIDRKSGVSYTPIIVGSQAIIATGNRATDPTVKHSAENFLNSKGIEVIAQAWSEDKNSRHQFTILLSEDFTNQIK